jgi:SWI/SNF-related matrix-associated actin-dependent regulator 1 of chromatin subfamily A
MKSESSTPKTVDSNGYDSDEVASKRIKSKTISIPDTDIDDDDDNSLNQADLAISPFVSSSIKPGNNNRIKSTISVTSELAQTLQKVALSSDEESVKIITKEYKKAPILLSSDDESLAPVPIINKSIKRRPIVPDSDNDVSDDEDFTLNNKKELVYLSSEDENDENDDVLSFFNDADLVELQLMTGGDKNTCSAIISARPFKSYDDIVSKLKKKKLSKRPITNYLEFKDGYTAADRIVRLCNGYHTKLQQSISSSNVVEVSLKPSFYEEDIELKAYQKIGVEWMLRLWHNKMSGILADEMGLGKTAQVITFLSYLLEQGETGPHLIVVPTTTLDNWIRELERFGPKLKVLIYQGTQAERAELQEMYPYDDFEFNVILTTEKQATANPIDRKYIKRVRPDSLIIDEAHMIKNVTTSRYEKLNSITTNFRLLMTGTPLQNNFQELIALLSFIMPRLFQDNRDDLEKICKFKFKPVTNNSEEGGSAEVLFNQNRIDKIKMMMDPFILRRNKDDVKLALPPKTDKVIHGKMTNVQKQLYREIVENARKAKEEKTFKRIENTLMEMRKIANHPLLSRNHYTDSMLESMSKKLIQHEEFPTNDVKKILKAIMQKSDLHLHQLCWRTPKLQSLCLDDSLFMESAKAKLLSEMLPKMIAKGDNILIFSQFTMMLDILEAIMETLDIKYIRMDGETKAEDRQPLIDDFNSDSTIKVFLLSTLAGGCGINLTAANVVILHDIGFNPQNDRQAECRAHRLGQKREVTVYRLLTENTLEMQIYKNGVQKLELDNKLKNSKGFESFQEEKFRLQIFDEILSSPISETKNL